MKQFIVTGMTCAACQARVESAVNKVAGVTACSVNLLTNSMGVEGSATEQEIISAVVAAGYNAQVKGKPQTPSDIDDSLKDRETPKLLARLIASLAVLVVLMYFSMGHMMWGWPIPSFLQNNHVAMGLLQMVLAVIIMVINQRFFVSGFKAVVHRSPNMDTLIAMGSAVSFGYSLWALFAMTSAQVNGGSAEAAKYMNELYFETAAMILTLITLGKTLEAKSKGKTTDALKSLMKMAPQRATVLQGEEEAEVAVSSVKAGDIFIVRPGESVPVDGIVLEGNSAVNEAALTGESIPVDKCVGDSVSAATINQSGYLKCRATRVGEDTTLSQIIKMVSDAAATKAPIAKIADKVSAIFVPAVLGIALVSFVVWLALGETVGTALSYAVAVLVISCPCALGLATPVAIMVGNGKGAKNGILFKTAAALEAVGKVNIVALDKTGTITCGQPKVTDIISANATQQELLELAYALESRSEHPLAKAVADKAKQQNIVARQVENFEALPGNGLSAMLDGKQLLGGSYKFINSKVDLSTVKEASEKLSEQGKTPLFFALDGKLLGIIAVADVIKEDSFQAVKQLQAEDIRVVMLTGDNQRTANAIGSQVGVDQVIAGVLPNEKEKAIQQLKKQGKVAMVGDGINDAPALTAADIGIAIGAGTDVAIDAADVVLVKSRLSDVPAAIRLGKATLLNIKENLFWAFIYNIIGIPLAAGAFSALGWKLNPVYGALAMSLSSFCVVMNALRLNLCNLYKTKTKNKEGQIVMVQNEKQNNSVTKIIKIEGMMCGHCEMHVKKALEALDGVSAEVSFQTGTAVVTLEKDIENSVLTSAVEQEGYKVVSVRYK